MKKIFLQTIAAVVALMAILILSACGAKDETPIPADAAASAAPEGTAAPDAKQSGQDLTYTDPFTNEKYVPYVIEPSVGVERMLLMLLCDAYDEETLENGDVRNILHLHPAIAPYKAAVLPLQKNKLGDKAREIYNMLSKKFMVDYDDSGAIGKRYRRHDEIGTPMCITVDFDTLEDNTVTVRDRDTMEQIRMPIDQLIAHIEQECDF